MSVQESDWVAGRPRREAQSRTRSGGPAGNERLTASTAAVLVLLLAAEGVTIVFIGSLLSAHVFIGMLLIGPVALKLASTGYRFLRYYAGSSSYRQKGPPAAPLRLLAPVVVLSTIAVFATGVALLLVGRRVPLLVTAHKASFIIWIAVTAVHVLAYIWRVPRLTAADWRGSHSPVPEVGGSVGRRLALAGVLVGGVVLALATLPLAAPWLGHLGGG